MTIYNRFNATVDWNISINNGTNILCFRSGKGDLMLSKHLCCSESCLLDITHGYAFLQDECFLQASLIKSKLIKYEMMTYNLYWYPTEFWSIHLSLQKYVPIKERKFHYFNTVLFCRSEVRHSKRRRVSSCTAFTWNDKLVSSAVEKSGN